MPSEKLLPSGALQSGTRAGWVTSPITAVSTASLIYDKEQQPCSQGIVDSEATPSLSGSIGAWENSTNLLLHVFTCVADTWSSDAAWDAQDDGLVFNAQSPRTGPVSFRPGEGSARISHDLVINSDGKISHHLWLFCILLAVLATRSHLGPSFRDLIERGPEAIASLAEFKAKLINVQRHAERLRHIHDGDSVNGDMEDGGNQGSTSSPPFPHPAPLSLKLDYDTEPDEPAQPPFATVQVQPRPAVTPEGKSISLTVGSGSNSPHPFVSTVILSRPLGNGPRDPSFSAIPQTSGEPPQSPLISCHPMLQATGESYQETSPSSVGCTAGYGAQRGRSRSAERERPPKRARRYSDSVVANRVDELGKVSPESARRGQHREVLDASDGDDVQMTDDATHRVALLLARIMVRLCHDRYRPPTLSKELRGVGMTAGELGDLLDVSDFVRSPVRIFGSSFCSYVCALVVSTLDHPNLGMMTLQDAL